MYAPDPSSLEICTVGGSLATNAGGLHCLKYEVARDSALTLEVVPADGSVVRPGHRTMKGVVGHHLTGLFVGSEGTLGIITSAVLRLRHAPRQGDLRPRRGERRVRTAARFSRQSRSDSKSGLHAGGG